MAVADLSDWLDEQSAPGAMWFAKRLAANDTLATGSHQVGPYVPKDFLFTVFPQLDSPDTLNPDVWFELYIDSHADHRRVRAIWYNNRLHGGTRNETRITNLGGRSSALLDPDSTGSLALLVFRLPAAGDVPECHAWVCDDPVSEDLIEDRLGPVDPGYWVVWSPDQPRQLADLFAPVPAEPPPASCWMRPEQIPPEWLIQFPSGQDIIRRTLELRPPETVPPDRRLLRRRTCEYEIFRSLEEAIELPVIHEGFSTIDEFLARAQSILQRRKARSGRSLELHAREIFLEEGLQEDADFAWGREAEQGRRPDFLFPSVDAYRDTGFPDVRLRMLAVKTTCKDRWRQILNEAGRIPTKHLLTLQEGVSVNQFSEMVESGVRLVVPELLHNKYPAEIRPQLQTLESFIGEVRILGAPV